MLKERVLRVLPGRIRVMLEKEQLEYRYLQEVRLRIGKPLLCICDGKERMIGNQRDGPYIVTKEDVKEMLQYVSNYSLYAYEQEMKQGFITIEGGHRVGMTGQAIIEDGRVKNLRYISSLNLRMSHEIKGCADPIFSYVISGNRVCHTLIVSPPRCGKTTLLRDMIRQISDGNLYLKGKSVGVVDERSEIGGCYMGVAQNELGIRTDILDCCPKAEGMIMLIRSMGPEVIAVDEIGTEEDVHAVEYAMHCGCRLIATVHGQSVEELKRKPVFERLIQEKRFERYILLGNQTRVGEIFGIYDSNEACLYRRNALEKRIC